MNKQTKDELIFQLEHQLIFDLDQYLMFDNKTNASFAISPPEDNDKLVSLQSRMQ